eukprot:m51a1_g8499 putative dis3-like exonuclease 2 (1216) ;mRNA; f:45904-49888
MDRRSPGPPRVPQPPWCARSSSPADATGPAAAPPPFVHVLARPAALRALFPRAEASAGQQGQRQPYRKYPAAPGSAICTACGNIGHVIVDCPAARSARPCALCGAAWGAHGGQEPPEHYYEAAECAVCGGPHRSGAACAVAADATFDVSADVAGRAAAPASPLGRAPAAAPAAPSTPTQQVRTAQTHARLQILRRDAKQDSPLAAAGISPNRTPSRATAPQPAAPATPTSPAARSPAPARSPSSSSSAPSRKLRFDEYLPEADVRERLARGTLLAGPLRINAKRRTDAYVTVEGLQRDVFVDGQRARNRAFDGDEVAVELLPRALWIEHPPEDPDSSSDSSDDADDVVLAAPSDVPADDDDDDDDNDDSDAHAAPAAPAAAAAPRRGGGRARAVREEQAELVALARAAGRCVQAVGVVVAVVAARHSATRTGFVAPLGRDGVWRPDDWAVELRPLDAASPIALVSLRESPELRAAIRERGGLEGLRRVLVAAEYTQWRASDRFPGARGARVLGGAGEIEAETTGILLDNAVDDSDFGADARACLPALPFAIPEAELRGRRDFRGRRVFTIDPATARDLDDALHCAALGDGTWEVGVHIADVSWFVRPGTALDRSAAARATSVYLVQRVVPMLPRELCEDLCSLNPARDRLAFSAVWRLDAEGRVLDEWLGRSVIRSCAQLSYALAQAAIDGAADGADGTVAEVVGDIRALHALALRLRAAREAAGTVSFGDRELSVRLDAATGLPVDAVPYELRDSNRLVEEFMLLANRRVAQRISDAWPRSALLRAHPPPDAAKLRELRKTFARDGLGEVETAGAAALQASLLRVVAGCGLRYAREVVSYFAARTMQLAQYFATGARDEPQWSHYALGFARYTHFTSPIRRYADVVVHRLLDAALRASAGDAAAAEAVPPMEEVAAVCRHCNERNRAAQKADESSARLYLGLLVRGRDVRCEAVVLAVQERFLSLYVPRYAFEHRVYLEDAPLRGWRVSAAPKSGAKTAVLRWPAAPASASGQQQQQQRAQGRGRKKAQEARRQLEYYMSDRNLRTDAFLREEMARTAEGSVRVAVLLRCNKLRALGADAELVARAVASSPVLAMTADGQGVVRAKKASLEVELEQDDDEDDAQGEGEGEGEQARAAIEQTIKPFDVVQVAVDVAPDRFPLELKVRLVHPLLWSETAAQQQQQQPAAPQAPAAPQQQEEGGTVVAEVKVAGTED